MLKLAAFIKLRREKIGLSQRKIAESAGVDQAYWGRLETGAQLGSLESLIQVARVLGVRPGFLIDVLAGLEEGEAWDDPENTIHLSAFLTDKDKQDIYNNVDAVTKRRVFESMFNNEQKESATEKALREARAAQKAELDRKLAELENKKEAGKASGN